MENEIIFHDENKIEIIVEDVMFDVRQFVINGELKESELKSGKRNKTSLILTKKQFEKIKHIPETIVKIFMPRAKIAGEYHVRRTGGNEIHFGYWTTENGRKRFIRLNTLGVNAK